MLEKTLESTLDYKEVKLVNPQGNQSWIFIWRADAEAEIPIMCPPDAKIWLIWKDHDAGRYWRWEEKGMTEDEMVELHHWLNGHELSKLWELVMGREAWRAEVHVVAKSGTWLGDWTKLNLCLAYCCYYSFAKSCLPLCDPMDHGIPGFPVLLHLLEFAQVHVHWVSDAI